MDRVPLLVGTKGPLSGKRYAISEAGLTVGRDETCDVIIPDAGVSRQHARVLLHNAAVWVQDEGSRNGVFVDGKRVVRHRQLSPGVEMLIGEHAFTLELSSDLREIPSSEEKTVPINPGAPTLVDLPTDDAAFPASRRFLAVGLGVAVLLALVAALWSAVG